MNIFKKIYCRSCQGVMKIVMRTMPYREPKLLEYTLEVPKVLKDANVNKPLIITTNDIVELKLMKSLTRALKDNAIKFEVFDGVKPNTESAIVEDAYNFYNEHKCDCIIAFGGGSAIDCAKAVSARVACPEKPLSKLKGLLKVKGELPLLIAIPTTAGTGSETSPSAVIIDSDTHHKYIINDFDLIPQYAVLDAEVTLSLPPYLTATTGMDALTHAVEAYIGRATTEQSRKWAKDAVRLIMDNLPRVMEDGKNERARAQMLKAANLAGLAFSRSFVGYVHAVSHTLSGKYNTPHGEANAVILPYILAEYGKGIYPKLRELAVYSEVARSYDSIEVAANKFINKIIELNEKFGIPKTFDYIRVEDIPELAKTADKEANPLYPVPKLMSAKELEKIYYKIKS